MKIMLAIDGSEYSKISTTMLKTLQLPSDITITMITVVPEYNVLGGITVDTILSTVNARKQIYRYQERRATELLKEPFDMLRATYGNVESMVCRGKTAEQIIKKAQEIDANLIVLGAKGSSNSRRFPLGNVAQKVVRYADCNVLLVRDGPNAIRRVFLASDGSEYSDQAAQLLLKLSLPKRSQVTILTALQSHTVATMNTNDVSQEINKQILTELKAAEEKAARSFMNKTKKKFEVAGYDTSLWVLSGEPAEEILEAANELNPELIVLGAKGLNDDKSVPLGNIAERVARFSRYSVLISRTSD